MHQLPRQVPIFGAGLATPASALRDRYAFAQLPQDSGQYSDTPCRCSGLIPCNDIAAIDSGPHSNERLSRPGDTESRLNLVALRIEWRMKCPNGMRTAGRSAPAELHRINKNAAYAMQQIAVARAEKSAFTSADVFDTACISLLRACYVPGTRSAFGICARANLTGSASFDGFSRAPGRGL